jgi:hypothetical protein
MRVARVFESTDERGKETMNASRTRILVVVAATAIAAVAYAGHVSATPAEQPTAVVTILSRTTLDDLDTWVRWGKLHSIVRTGRDEQAEVVFQHGVLQPGFSGGWHTTQA